jgi:hypothetical protein
VLEIEDRNRKLFEKHSNLNIGGFKSHFELFDYAFGKHFLKNGGCGVLDIGTGAAGVFLLEALSKTFVLPRIAIDAFEVSAPLGWQKIVMNGRDIDKFGKIFDHVQCIETLEHVLEKEQEEIVRKMRDVSRGTCLITCCGLSHHLGELNKQSVERNLFLDYKGQPNIEMLMDLGYKVKLIGAYQILAWAIA